ncbi:MAG TPA: hypothetical protein VER03_12240 [Bryobacteraceae bacterium]|nr:hypothetical protein [Bryobacteraceae bacterium]
MKKLSRLALPLVSLLAWAQDAPKPSLTAEQIIEKSIERTGGREARLKNTTLVFSGVIEIPAAEVTGKLTYAGKAPQQAVVTVAIEGWGEQKTGYDGKTGWMTIPGQPVQILDGGRLERLRRNALFNSDIHWRKLFTKAEYLRREKVAGRDTYVVQFTPSGGGAPTLRYYDAENFEELRVDTESDTAAGAEIVQRYHSDFDPVTHFPRTIREVSSVGETIIRVSKVEFDAPVDDKQFAPPVATVGK